MLRDDLFLDSRGAAVVRSYEACEPEAQLRLRLSGTLNATLAARRSAVAAPLPILAVIYFGTHHERLHAVRAYERYFRRLVYMSPNREIVRAVGKLRSRGSSGAEVHAHHCTRWIKATYMCVASVAPALMDAELQSHVEAAAEQHAPGNWMSMPSGAGHDAQTIALVMPAAMLFVPSIGGLSHVFDENTDDDDLVL